MECDARLCPAGPFCQNQRLQRAAKTQSRILESGIGRSGGKQQQRQPTSAIDQADPGLNVTAGTARANAAADNDDAVKVVGPACFSSASSPAAVNVRPAGGKGLGLFAGPGGFPRGALVSAYVGEVVNSDEAERRREAYKEAVSEARGVGPLRSGTE